jgi:hypothetical protein
MWKYQNTLQCITNLLYFLKVHVYFSCSLGSENPKMFLVNNSIYFMTFRGKEVFLLFKSLWNVKKPFDQQL